MIGGAIGRGTEMATWPKLWVGGVPVVIEGWVDSVVLDGLEELGCGALREIGPLETTGEEDVVCCDALDRRSMVSQILARSEVMSSHHVI